VAKENIIVAEMYSRGGLSLHGSWEAGIERLRKGLRIRYIKVMLPVTYFFQARLTA
jgi:hypothetical protein